MKKVPAALLAAAALAIRLVARRGRKENDGGKPASLTSPSTTTATGAALDEDRGASSNPGAREHSTPSSSTAANDVKLVATTGARAPLPPVEPTQWPEDRSGDEEPTTPRMGLDPPPIPAQVQAQMVNRLQNEALAHELVLNPAFQLRGGGSQDPVSKQVGGVMKKAYWDMFRERTAAGDFKVVTDNLMDVKNRLHSLIPERRTDMHEALDKNFDFEFVKEQIEHRAFDVGSLRHILHIVLDTILQLESPGRTKETREWRAEREKQLADAPEQWEAMLPGMFEFITEKLDQISLDIANWQVRIAADWLREHGIRFEQDKFEEKLQAGTLTLEVTDRWAGETAAQVASSSYLSAEDKALCAAGAGVGPETEQQATFLNYRFGVFQLLQTDTPLSRSTCPEILWMDLPRLVDLQNNLQAMTLIGALLMVNAGLLGEKGCQPSASDAAMFKADLKKLLAHPQSHIRLLIDYMQRFFAKVLEEQGGQEASDSDKEFVKRMVEKTTSTADPFYAQMNKRLLQALWVSLRLNDDAEAARAVEAQRLSMREELLVACAELRPALRHNLLVHGARLQGRFVEPLPAADDDLAPASPEPSSAPTPSLADCD